MLPPIPSRILRSTVTIDVCTGIDIYQNQEYTSYTVKNVHLQPTERIVKTTTNTDQQLTGILYVDAKKSVPALNWRAMLETAHELGGDMHITVRNVKYTVMTVDGLRDDTDNLHHWEIGVV